MASPRHAVPERGWRGPGSARPSEGLGQLPRAPLCAHHTAELPCAPRDEPRPRVPAELLTRPGAGSSSANARAGGCGTGSGSPGTGTGSCLQAGLGWQGRCRGHRPRAGLGQGTVEPQTETAALAWE